MSRRESVWLALGLCGGLWCAAVPSAAGAAPDASVTIRGEVVDPAGYLKDGRHGPELTQATYEAVDGGQTLAILEDGTGTLYLLLGERPGDDPSGLVYDLVNEHVTIVGIPYERGGLKGLVVTSAQPIDDAPAEAEAPKEPAATP